MPLAQIGPLTAVIEALATAVGAGVVLCSVAAGIWGSIQGSARAHLEKEALVSGYVGGGVGAVLAFVDLIMRYGLME
jgi:hypothetical protein